MRFCTDCGRYVPRDHPPAGSKAHREWDRNPKR